MKLTEKIAYMKGLLDGMELDGSTKEGKAILQMADVMEEMGVYIDDLQSQVDELTELCDLLDHDLGEVETDLYCDDDDDDFDPDDDDDFRFDDDEDDDDAHFRIGKVLPADYDDFAYEDSDEYDNEIYIVNCPSCDEAVNLTECELEEGSIVCPHCGELLEFNYDDIEQDFSENGETADDEAENSEGDAE